MDGSIVIHASMSYVCGPGKGGGGVCDWGVCWLVLVLVLAGAAEFKSVPQPIRQASNPSTIKYFIPVPQFWLSALATYCEDFIAAVENPTDYERRWDVSGRGSNVDCAEVQDGSFATTLLDGYGHDVAVDVIEAGLHSDLLRLRRLGDIRDSTSLSERYVGRIGIDPCYRRSDVLLRTAAREDGLGSKRYSGTRRGIRIRD